MKASDRGKLGELAAAGYLRKHRYDILNANYKTRLGEIDLIASDGVYLAFVEVKTRTEGSMLTPREAVDAKKRRRIILTAQLFLSENRYDLQPRFDVIEVYCRKEESFKVTEIVHIPNAFSTD